MYHYTLDSAFVDCFAKFNLALAELQHHNVNRVETGRLLKSGVHIKFAVMLCMRFGDRKIASPEKQLQYFLPSTGCCVCHEAAWPPAEDSAFQLSAWEQSFCVADSVCLVAGRRYGRKQCGAGSLRSCFAKLSGSGSECTLVSSLMNR